MVMKLDYNTEIEESVPQLGKKSVLGKKIRMSCDIIN